MSNIHVKFFLMVLFLGPFSSVFSQGNIKKANELFNNLDYSGALTEYREILKYDSSSHKVLYRTAVCYVNASVFDKSQAVTLLNLCEAHQDNYPNFYYILGKAYHLNYDFDKAVEAYKKFKYLNKGSAYNKKYVDREIENCFNAKELIKFPKDVTFKKLSEDVNSEYADYYPFIPVDETYLMFNSRRDDGSKLLSNGKYASEIYLSRIKNGKFYKAKKLDQNINTLEGLEEVVGVSPNGKYVVLYFENEKYYGDLMVGTFNGKKIEHLELLPKTINTKNGHEIAATVTNDGRTIYFASNQEGGFGGVDIYSCNRLPNGSWAEIQNLGEKINTAYDEDFPALFLNEKELYFSSKGHTSIGGYDIFKAKLDPSTKKWGQVENIGYPINTPSDDNNLRFSSSNRTGYISTIRDGDSGKEDIYEVTFNKVERPYTVVLGYIHSNLDSAIIKDQTFISVLDVETNEVFGDYTPNQTSGRYIMILPAGKYNVMIESDGYQTLMQNIEIFGKGNFENKIEQSFLLKPIKTSP